MSPKVRPTDFAERWQTYRGTSFEPGIKAKYSRWERIKKFFAKVFTPGGEFWKKRKEEGEEVKPSIDDDARLYQTTHFDCTTEEMVEHLKSKNWSIEEIRGMGGRLREAK